MELLAIGPTEIGKGGCGVSGSNDESLSIGGGGGGLSTPSDSPELNFNKTLLTKFSIC